MKKNSLVSELKSGILIASGLTCSVPQLIKHLFIFLSSPDSQYQLSL